MIMLHGLRGPGSFATVAEVPTTKVAIAPGTCSADGTMIWDAGGFWRRLRVGERCSTTSTMTGDTRVSTGGLVPPPTTKTATSSGCPTGYVMSEFGCMAPTAPSAPCPAGSIQTGSGCLPQLPAPAPTQPPPAPTVFPPVPTSPPTGITRPLALTLDEQIKFCSLPENNTSASCTRLFADLEAATGIGPSTKTSPGAQVTPVAPIEPIPVAITPPKASKGTIVLGVLGALAAAAAVVIGTRH